MEIAEKKNNKRNNSQMTQHIEHMHTNLNKYDRD